MMKNKVAAIIFSYKRPLQLDICLKSLKKHCIGDLNVFCIVKIDNPKEQSLYEILQKEHPNITFVWEENLRTHIERLLIDYYYVLFATDDTVFVRDFNLNEITEILDTDEEVLGFSLRLGENCQYCYPVSKNQIVPKFVKTKDNIDFWKWGEAELDWNYPLEVSSSIYQSLKILYFLSLANFMNPNYFEFYMDHYKSVYLFDYPLMACYDISRGFAMPINKINPENKNRSGNNPKYSIENLLIQFEKGVRIDISQFDNFIPNACHQEVEWIEELA